LKPTNVLIREIIEMVVPVMSKKVTGLKRMILDKEMVGLLDSLRAMSPEDELEAYELLLKIRNKLNKEMGQ
jgi:hypothetical protein